VAEEIIPALTRERSRVMQESATTLCWRCNQCSSHRHMVFLQSGFTLSKPIVLVQTVALLTYIQMVSHETLTILSEIPVPLIIHHYPITEHCIVQVTDSIIKETESK
jgi:hypothetical protein